MNKYKVLSAMLNLNEFTAEDLEHYTGLKINTIRVIIGRQEALLEQVGIRDNGGRGGQYKVYRVRPDRVDELRARIHGVYANLLLPTLKDEQVSVPLSLRAAEDVLKRRYLEEDSVPKKEKLFTLAQIRLESARQETELLTRQASTEVAQMLESRLRSAELLRDLCAKELAVAAAASSASGAEALDFMRKFKDAANDLKNQGEPNEALSYLTRLVESPVLTTALAKSAN